MVNYKLYGYPKSPCQVSEKFIIGKVDCNRGYPSWSQDEQVLLIGTKIQNNNKSPSIGYFLLCFVFNEITDK